MQEIVNNFGINWYLLAAQIVNFLIIIWLLQRFAYKPILSMLEKRKKLIAQGVADAQKAQTKLQETLDEEKAILKKAQQEATALVADAAKQAQEILAQAEEGAKGRVERILEEGKQDIKQQTLTAQKTLAKQTAQLAVDLLEKSLKGMVDSKAEKEIVEKVTKKIQA